ncbi:unnamed protein product [Chrysoparadoxa australica]
MAREEEAKEQVQELSMLLEATRRRTGAELEGLREELMRANTQLGQRAVLYAAQTRQMSHNDSAEIRLSEELVATTAREGVLREQLSLSQEECRKCITSQQEAEGVAREALRERDEADRKADMLEKELLEAQLKITQLMNDVQLGSADRDVANVGREFAAELERVSQEAAQERRGISEERDRLSQELQTLKTAATGWEVERAELLCEVSSLRSELEQLTAEGSLKEREELVKTLQAQVDFWRAEAGAE